MDERNAKNGFERKDTLIIIGLILFFSFCFYVASLYMNRGEIISQIKGLEADQIESILIAPRNLGKFPNLSNYSITLEDKKLIGLICEALSNAYKFGANHPVSVWDCVVTIKSKDKEIKFVVIKSNHRNGVLIHLYSNGTWGFSLCTLRADALGEVLEAIVRNTFEGHPFKNQSV